MCAPGLGIEAFLDLAVDLGVTSVEIRNDLAGQAILDGTPPETIRRSAENRRLRIASINALQRFNDWTEGRAAEARALVDYASACGAEALVLVPVNDGSGRANGERQANLRIALKALAPMLQDAGIVGLVEPLGFAECSLRLKSEAAEAIRSTGTAATFRLVHDTFHHHIAGEPELFTDMTGLVHISGVTDQAVPVSEMRDPHRVLVDARDRLGNIEQLGALRNAGYSGPLSFEPFAPAVHGLADIASAVRSSMVHIAAALSRSAA
jgi:2-keto-myo-inositol isomerase